MKYGIQMTQLREIKDGHRGPAKFMDKKGLWTVRLTREHGVWHAQPLVEEAPIRKGSIFSILEGRRIIAICKVL